MQTFTLTVTEAPAFTSAASTTFTVGTAGTFTVTTTGEPDVTTIVLGGATLPSGVTFVNNGDGTATLSGTPAAATGGTDTLTFTANNGVGGHAADVHADRQPGARVHQRDRDHVHRRQRRERSRSRPSGVPAITAITRGGAALPAGVTFVDNGDGTATLSGTPAAGNRRHLRHHLHREQRHRPPTRCRASR